MNKDIENKISEMFRRQDFISKIIELLAVTQGQIPLSINNYGHFIKPYDGSGFVGGTIKNIVTDSCGNLRANNVTVSSLLGCGHLVTNINQIAGICRVCGKICCKNHNCLLTCDFTGITVCRQHYKIKHGVVVSSIAQRGLWKWKAKKLGMMKRALIDDRKQLTEKE